MEYSSEYYLTREAKEREMARMALDPAIAKIHRELAEHYMRLAAAAQSEQLAHHS